MAWARTWSVQQRALKAMRLKAPEEWEDFRNEVAIMRRLKRHHNIVHMIDAAQDNVCMARCMIPEGCGKGKKNKKEKPKKKKKGKKKKKAKKNKKKKAKK